MAVNDSHNMMDFILTSGKACKKLPLGDAVVDNHFQAANSYVQCLLQQINIFRSYEELFAGGQHLTFLDLGANMGLVSVYAHDVCDRVVAVEPAPDTFAVLERMAVHFPKISTLNAALAPQDGPCVFHINNLNTTASSVVNTYGTEIKVNGMTLHSILEGCSLDRVDVCKVDVEGSEGKSLNMDEVKLAMPIIRAYYVETHNCPESTWNQKLGDLVSIFSEVGYGTMKIDGMGIYAKRND